MPSLIPIVIVVSGIVFTSGLIGTFIIQYENFFKSENLTCDCRVDLDSDFFPWQVSLGKTKIDRSIDSVASLERLQLYTHLCGGVLVNSKFVLASSHCVRFNYDQPLGIGLSSGDLIAIYNNGRIPIKKIIYNSTNIIDDICLIELEREVDLKNELIRPACFRSLETITEIRNDLIATGWNLIEKTFANKDYFAISRYHNQLRFKDVSFQDKNCDRKSKICVRAKDYSNCNQCYSETGAPIHMIQTNLTTVVGIQQISLISQSNRSTDCPEIYFTRIAPKLEFIQSVVKNQICLV